MTDLGSSVRLTASNVDGDGNLADPAGGPSLTVALPDGTSTTLTSVVQHDGTGEWHADLVTSQAGRHIARWVGTGAGAFSYVEAFTVDPSDPGFLFTLEQAKRSLRKIGASSADDETIREYMAAVTPVIEDIVGPILPKSMDEWYDGGGQMIALTTTPVLSVTSVTESWGANSIRLLTDQPLDGVTPVDTYGYTIDLATGILQRRVSGIAGPFVGGRRNVHVVYVAGQALKPNWQLAAREQFRFLWQFGQQGGRPGWGDTQDQELDETPAGYAVPRAVVQLCGAGDARIPGIA